MTLKAHGKTKRLVSTLAIILALVILAGGICVYYLVPGVRKLKVTVHSDSVIKTVYGWGTSACWWSQNVSDEATREELSKLLFSEEGLGLNIYRYNIGGGFDENERTSNPWRRAESFYVLNEQTGEFEYDFSRDANAYAFLKKSLSYGCIDTVVLFANSPHYSFTVSGMASGSLEESTCNLKKECYRDYVDYFLTITKHFIDDGVPVKFISPINEPQWSWGGDWVGQEGCHYEPDEALELLHLFAEGIAESGLDVKLMAPESGEIYGETENYFNRLTSDEAVQKVLGSLAYHSYWSDNYVKLKESFGSYIDKNLSDTRVDMTEWCELPCWHSTDDVNSAIVMARVIANDMQLTHSSSWTSWVAVNQDGINSDDGKNYSDGLISANDDLSQYAVAARYNALAHFSEFVPTGSVLLEADADMSTLVTETDWSISWLEHPKREMTTYQLSFAAFRTPEGKTVLVLVNEGEARTVRLDVKGKSMQVITTDEAHSLEQTYEGRRKGRLSLSQNSITTVIFD